MNAYIIVNHVQSIKYIYQVPRVRGVKCCSSVIQVSFIACLIVVLFMYIYFSTKTTFERLVVVRLVLNSLCSYV